MIPILYRMELDDSLRKDVRRFLSFLRLDFKRVEIETQLQNGKIIQNSPLWNYFALVYVDSKRNLAFYKFDFTKIMEVINTKNFIERMFTNPIKYEKQAVKHFMEKHPRMQMLRFDGDGDTLLDREWGIDAIFYDPLNKFLVVVQIKSYVLTHKERVNFKDYLLNSMPTIYAYLDTISLIVNSCHGVIIFGKNFYEDWINV